MRNVFQEWIAHATAFDWITNLSAFIAVGFLALVIIGFRRYIKRPRIAPIDFVATGIWILAFVKMIRLFWWDLLPDFMGHHWSYFGLGGATMNWAFNVVVVWGCYYMLKGYWLLVEERAPGHYNLFTAVFYPKRLRLWITARGESDE